MKVFFIESAEQISDAESKFGNLSEVKLLDKSSKDIDDYQELISDNSNKILAIAPGRIDWKVPNGFLDKVPNLKAICTKSSWAHYLDLDYCKSNKIIVTNIPGANSQSVAEYAIWQMFSLARKLPIQIAEKYQHSWDNSHEQTEISNKVMGIIGLGQIGSRLAKLGEGLGMKIVYWSRTPKDTPYSYLELDEVIKQSDFLFNCLEISSETKGLLNSVKLDLLHPNAYFISVLGGAGYGVQDDNHLIGMVRNKKLSGFSIEGGHEPGYIVPDITGLNIFIPGAYAWFTKEANIRSNQMLVEAIKGILSGQPIYRVA